MMTLLRWKNIIIKIAVLRLKERYHVPKVKNYDEKDDM